MSFDRGSHKQPDYFISISAKVGRNEYKKGPSIGLWNADKGPMARGSLKGDYLDQVIDFLKDYDRDGISVSVFKNDGDRRDSRRSRDRDDDRDDRRSRDRDDDRDDRRSSRRDRDEDGDGFDEKEERKSSRRERDEEEEEGFGKSKQRSRRESSRSSKGKKTSNKGRR